MKTLEEIKDDYVMDRFLASQELDTWVAFQNYFSSMHPEWFEQHWEEIAERYATECAKEALRLASENAEFIAEHQFYEETIKDRIDNVGSHLVSIDKHSILSEENLPKHR